MPDDGTVLLLQAFGSALSEDPCLPTPPLRAHAGSNATQAASTASATASLRHSVRGHPISDILEGTLWNRDLGTVSEDMVVALVQQLFNGIRDYLVQVRTSPRPVCRNCCNCCATCKKGADMGACASRSPPKQRGDAVGLRIALHFWRRLLGM